MFHERRSERLTWLAIHLIGIAIRVSLCAPARGRTAKPASERARKRFGRAKPNRQGNAQNLRPRLRGKSYCRDLNAPSTQIIANGLAHPRGKESMKVEWRKMCDAGQGVEVKRLIQMLINVCEYPMHSAFVF